MHVILEYFTSCDPSRSHIYITEGDLYRIEKWCESFPDNMVIIAASQSLEHTLHPILPWERVLEEAAWESAFNYHLESNIESNLVQADREDAKVYTTKLRDTLVGQLRDACRARHVFGGGIRLRVASTIRYKIKLIRQVSKILDLLN